MPTYTLVSASQTQPARRGVTHAHNENETTQVLVLSYLPRGTHPPLRRTVRRDFLALLWERLACASRTAHEGWRSAAGEGGEEGKRKEQPGVVQHPLRQPKDTCPNRVSGSGLDLELPLALAWVHTEQDPPSPGDKVSFSTPMLRTVVESARIAGVVAEDGREVRRASCRNMGGSAIYHHVWRVRVQQSWSHTFHHT